MAGRTKIGGLKMKFILIAFAAVGFIGSTTTFGVADTPVSQEEAEKIKAALDALGCTGGKMEKESGGSTFAYKVDDAKCRGGEYDIKLDQNFNVIIMLRD
jgi:hypothetical protein